MRIEHYLPGLQTGLHYIATAAKPREACGVLTDAGLVDVPNLNSDPTEQFSIGPLHELLDQHGPIQAIWHTHPNDEPPSLFDVVACRSTSLPWIIAGPTRIWVIHPRTVAYQGRDFVYGENDCWQLISDWFAGERSVYLPWFPRPPDGWWAKPGPSPYLEAAGQYGFDVKPIETVGYSALKAGDVLLMQIAGVRINHAALYIGGGTILHHLYGCLSIAELLDERYQRFTRYVGRLTSP